MGEFCQIRSSIKKFEEVLCDHREMNLLASQLFYLLLQYALLPPSSSTEKREEELAIEEFYNQLSPDETHWLTERDTLQAQPNTRAQIIRLAVNRRIEEILEAARIEQEKAVKI